MAPSALGGLMSYTINLVKEQIVNTPDKARPVLRVKRGRTYTQTKEHSILGGAIKWWSKLSEHTIWSTGFEDKEIK